MKRLVETDAEGDATLRAALGLLEHVQPVADNAASKHRVRSRIAARGMRRSSLSVGRLVLLFVLLLAGVAGARGMDRGGWSRARERVTSWLTGRTVVPPAAGVRTPAVRRAGELGSAPSAAAATPEVPVLAEIPRQGVPARARPAYSRISSVPPKLATPPSASAAPASPPVSDPGSELMVAAMRARSAGDLATAERLLSDYRRRFPSGALAEEALALSVETAALRGSQLAPELARAYLGRFPGGRYRTWVERTLVAPR